MQTAIGGVSHPTLKGLWSLVPKASKFSQGFAPVSAPCSRALMSADAQCLITAKEEKIALNNLFVDLHPV